MIPSLALLSFGLSSAWAASSTTPPKNIVPMKDAEKAALATVPGKVKSSELEHEAGKWIYSFDIVKNDKTLHEVWVDAKSGKVSNDKVETPTEEANEAKAEQGH